jgi:transcriptional regulator with XRE-family HTH domain
MTMNDPNKARNRRPSISFDESRRELFTIPGVKEAYDERQRIMAIGQHIRQARVRGGLTQQQLAERMGTTQPEIVRLEAGQGPRGPALAMLRRIADAVNEVAFLGFSEADNSGVTYAEAIHEAVAAMRQTGTSEAAIHKLESILTMEAI